MAKKLTMNGQFRKSVAEVFDDFVIMSFRTTMRITRCRRPEA